MKRHTVWVGLVLGLAAALLAADDLETALAAIDRGSDPAARPLLAARKAESGFWLAVSERGAARLAAAREVAADVAAPEWMRTAAGALVAVEEGNRDAAIAGLRQATALAPGEARLWKLLGDQLQAGGEADAARAAWEQAVALRPDHPTANMALGDLARRRGDFGAAFNAYNHAVDARGEPLAARFGRATARLFMGDAEGAVAELEEVARQAAPGPELARARMGLFYVRAYQRRTAEGIASAEAAVRVWEELGRPELAAGLANATARVLLETGDPEGAESWYLRGGQLIAGSALGEDQRALWRVRELHGLARVAASRRQLPRARELAAEARRLMAGDPANAEHYAWIGPYLEGYLLLAERRSAEAAVELGKSDLERPYIAWLLGEAQARNRNREAARGWYERALAAADGLDAESVIVRPLALAALERDR